MHGKYALYMSGKLARGRRGEGGGWDVVARLTKPKKKKSSTAIFKDNICTVSLKCGQGHITRIYPVLSIK